MIERLFEERIKYYSPADSLEQEHVIQEILQQSILAILSRAGFFSRAIFHGGTCLKMFHGLPRFSEDLDFILIKEDKAFSWDSLLLKVVEDAEELGIFFKIRDRSKAGATVKKAFFKTDSKGAIISTELPFQRDKRKMFRIKLELDIHPPHGSEKETRFLTFPFAAAVTTQMLTSGFALKLHALLSRSYDKGRDWYDFIWYVARKIRPNYDLCSAAMMQSGPWQGQNIVVDASWLAERLTKKIQEVDWEVIKSDVARFLPSREIKSLDLWKEDLFLYHVGEMKAYL